VSNSRLDDGGATEAVVVAVPRHSAGGLLARLRQARLVSHEHIDRAVSKLQLRHAADYGAFLNLHYSVLRVMQPNWRIEDDVDFQRFATCLEADLRAVGVPKTSSPLPRLADIPPPGRIGLAYLIRGSRLGTQFLRSRVPAGFASSFFDCPVTVAWPAFLRQLDEVSLTVTPEAEASKQGSRR
jgi:heme oxygenase